MLVLKSFSAIESDDSEGARSEGPKGEELGLRLKIGIITVSDRASGGEYEDASGPAVRAALGRRIASAFDTIVRLVPDDRPRIRTALEELSDEERCALVIATGGTGPAPRDVTPEAVLEVADRVIPGFGERMRQAAWDRIPTALLSRQIGATRGTTLILALPGNPRAIEECLSAVFAAVPHCLELLGGPRIALRGAEFDPGH